MKTAEEVLKPYVEKIMRHTEVVEKDNAITAMNRFADQFRLPDVMHWVAMSERQPEDYKRVLWFDSRDGNVQVGYFVKETQVPYATHWMELPQPPCA